MRRRCALESYMTRTRTDMRERIVLRQRELRGRHRICKLNHAREGGCEDHHIVDAPPPSRRLMMARIRPRPYGAR